MSKSFVDADRLVRLMTRGQISGAVSQQFWGYGF